MLTVANPTPFTHILKIPGKDHFESIGAVEWFSLELSEAAGLKTSKHALVDLPCGMAPGVLVERFDIPHSQDPNTRYLIADLCSIACINPDIYKREYTDKKCIDIVKGASTNQQADLEALFKRLTFAYLIHDYDAHLKNISMLKTVDMRDPEKTDVRFSPVYDPVVTTVFMPQHRKLSISIGGRYDNIPMEQLAQLGKKCGLEKDRAEQVVRQMAALIANKAVEIANAPPPAITANTEWRISAETCYHRDHKSCANSRRDNTCVDIRLS